MFRRRMKQRSIEFLSKIKNIREKINKICDSLLMDVLEADTTKNKRNKWRAKY